MELLHERTYEHFLNEKSFEEDYLRKQDNKE